jgi:hypothetical protein
MVAFHAGHRLGFLGRKGIFVEWGGCCSNNFSKVLYMENLSLYKKKSSILKFSII